MWLYSEEIISLMADTAPERYGTAQPVHSTGNAVYGQKSLSNKNAVVVVGCHAKR